MARKMLRKLLLFIFFIGTVNLSFLSAGETVKVEQKDWRDYFPNIETHLSAYEPEFREVDMSYETPHTKWAKPYYRGTVKVLVIAPRTCQRDTVELAQRLDMKFDAFCALTSASLGGGTEISQRLTIPVGFTQEEQLTHLNDFLNKEYDVIIIGHMYWTAFPKETWDKVLNKVKNGTGLVIAFLGNEKDFVPPALALEGKPSTGEALLMMHGIPFDSLDSWRRFKTEEKAADSILNLKEFGKGRVVVINSGEKSWNTFFVPQPSGNPERKIWQVDYYFSLAAKTVLWAARKMPQSNIGCVIKDGVVEIKTTTDREPFKKNFRLRNEQGDVVCEKTGVKSVFKLPELRAGRYIADVILKRGDRSVNWYSTSLVVNKKLTIQSVKFNPSTIKPDTRLVLNTTLSCPVGKSTQLRVKVIDTFGRLINDTHQNLSAGQSMIETEITLRNVLSNLLRVEATLFSDKQELSYFETSIPVKLPHSGDDFKFACWNLFSIEYPWYYALKELSKLGVDASYGGRDQTTARMPATAGIFCIPYLTRYAINKTTSGPHRERIPCLSNPEFIKKEQENIAKMVRELSPYGPAAYSLGDENNLSLNDVEVCFSETCRLGFRKYAEKIYGSLDWLNREWDTSYDSWDKIEPLTLAEAREKHQPARWVDFRMYMEDVFLNIHKLGRETIKKIDPEALVGFDGGYDITSFTGYDWWKLSQVLDFWGVYPDHLQSEILRSFHKKEARTGRWYGGYDAINRFTEYNRWEPWYELFHEMNNAFWFNVIPTAYEVQAEDAFNPATFKPFSILKASSEEIREIKSGTGKLLLGCRRDTGGIAILYSQSSLHAATFYEKYGNPNDSQYDFIRILEDLNYQYRFISYEQLSQGILEKEGYKLLILPCSIALSDGEKKQIVTFLAAGGKVIADASPGIYDAHGKPVEDEGWANLVKEKVVLINEIIKGYKKNTSGAEKRKQIFSKKLKELGMMPEIYVVPDSADTYEGEISVFSDGDIKYVGLLRDHSPKTKAQQGEIRLPDKKHIYSMRTGKYLGYGNAIKTNLEAGTAGLWALLPEKVSGINIILLQRDRQEDKEVKYSITMKTHRRHVVRVEVFDPKGILQRHYCSNLVLQNGKATGTVPLALNDKKGTWIIRVKDVATGLATYTKFTVR